jgi:hypothetical protein
MGPPVGNDHESPGEKGVDDGTQKNERCDQIEWLLSDTVAQDVDDTAHILVAVAFQAGWKTGASTGCPPAARTIPEIPKNNKKKRTTWGCTFSIFHSPREDVTRREKNETDSLGYFTTKRRWPIVTGNTEKARASLSYEGEWRHWLVSIQKQIQGTREQGDTNPEGSRLSGPVSTDV